MMKDTLHDMANKQRVIVVANGKFPEHDIPLSILSEANILVCCDGAIVNLTNKGYTPNAIVGDLDSLTNEYRIKFANILFHDPDQNTNDLTKAIKWCLDRNLVEVDIIGATGLREDHTLGNIGLLPMYARIGLDVRMLTDNGFFVPILHSTIIKSYVGQQVSIFSPNNSTKITTENLKYPIIDSSLPEYWMGTLNESIAETFMLEFNPGPLILFQKY